ncbi:hypothetical protein BZA77DRAFT_306810 [Pyronema omphalodes]|nr:hypothetical protein BZA77DRAFT_306810 [Pyronema omphalodes]
MPTTKPTSSSGDNGTESQGESQTRHPPFPLPETMTAPPTNTTSCNYNDSPEFTSQTLSLSQRLLSFTALIVQLGHDWKTYPRALDEARDITNELFDVRRQVHDYNASPEMKYRYLKLKTEFTAALQDLEAELRVVEERLRPGVEGYRDQEQVERYRDEEEEVGVEDQQNQEVRNIKGAINVVESIFNELGVEVQEQRDDIMVIRGKQQTRAEDERNGPGWEQRRNQRRQCWAAVGLVGVVLISIFVVS